MKKFLTYPLGRQLLIFLSSGFLTGYIPFASGTFATLLAVGLVYPFRTINQPAYPAAIFFIIALLAIIAVSIALAEFAERTYKEKDSHKIVIDEIAGFFIAMTFVPFHWPHVAAAFIIFRVMDVLKPPPIYRLQVLPGGWGVVIDDLLAGFYTCLILQGMMWVGVLQ